MLQNLMAYVQNISGKSLMHQKDDQLSKNCNSFYMIHLQHKRYSRKYFPQEEYVFAVRLLWLKPTQTIVLQFPLFSRYSDKLDYV